MPSSTIPPCSSTTRRSMAAIVERRWAMAITVLPCMSVVNCSWIAASTSESRAEVASSSTSSGAFLSSTRAMATRCRCPPESLTPRSPTWAS
ncbi:hypothetical protein D3C72_1894350 [compost metagenome]